MPLADVVVLNSYQLRDFALQFESASPDRLVIIPNGVVIDNYCQPYTREYLFGEFGVSQADFVIGSAGRMTYQKGFDLLLDAVARIPDRRVQLLLVGEGEDEPTLRQRAAKNGLNGSVHFTGYRRDLPRLLGALDLYVQPSRFEGMPNALLEAMAAGCPVIASAVDGIIEMVLDGYCGWLTPPEDSRALADTISMALSNPAEAHRQGGAARRRVGISFTLDQMVGRWEKVLYA
jgi:glycosyltransferase involved in cell wall biosynthesis